jgi:hypothetical protein
MLTRGRDFLKTFRVKLKENMENHLNERIERENIELLCYIICNQSGLGGTGKSRYSENMIKCKIKKKLDLYQYWELDDVFVYWVNFFISFYAIYLTHMKVKQLKKEITFGEYQKENVKSMKKKFQKCKNRSKRNG